MPYYIKSKPKPKRTLAHRKPALSTLTRKLDALFSRYIRLRDAMQGGTFRCIACGKIKPIEQADCGHFFSRRHMSTRYDEDNCHAECKACNRFSADHLIGYRANLIQKIGENRVNLLEVKAHRTRKWYGFELEELIKLYSERIKELQKEKGIQL